MAAAKWQFHGDRSFLNAEGHLESFLKYMLFFLACLVKKR